MMTKIKLTHHENTPVPEEVGIVAVQLLRTNGQHRVRDCHLVDIFKIRDQLCYRFLNDSKVHPIDEWPFETWDDGK